MQSFKAVLSFKTIKTTELNRMLSVDYAFDNLKQAEDAREFTNQELFTLADIFTEIAKGKFNEDDAMCFPLPPTTIYLQRNPNTRTSVHYMIDITPAYKCLGSYDLLSKHEKFVEFMQRENYSFNMQEYGKHLSDSRK
jgi:hypothetical protein